MGARAAKDEQSRSTLGKAMIVSLRQITCKGDLLGEGTKTPSLIGECPLMLRLYGDHHGRRFALADR